MHDFMAKITRYTKTVGWNPLFIDGEPIGLCRGFCCGVDYQPFFKDVIFSINSFDANIVEVCVKAIQSIKIPNNDGRYNFDHKIARNPLKMSEYERKINHE